MQADYDEDDEKEDEAKRAPYNWCAVWMVLAKPNSMQPCQ
jgi:hypothetical protein